jgi:hypothetical protein
MTNYNDDRTGVASATVEGGSVRMIGERSVVVGWTIATLIVLAARHARAQPPLEPAPMQLPDDRPWARGVSDADQALATELYIAGNHEFSESRFAQALAKYREAIAHWDHPAIRFNMAVCQINLDRPVDARNNLTRSLAYDERPLGPVKYSQALTYRKLLDAQLAHVKVVCDEPGAQIMLDGKLVFRGPGAVDEYLMPGTHQVVATKAGFPTASQAFVGVANQLTEIQLTVEPPPQLPAAPRWGYWKHLAIGGGALVALGAASYLASSRSFAGYDRDLARRCPSGCDAETLATLPDVTATRDRGELEQVIAFSALAVGAAAVTTAVIGLVADRPHTPAAGRALAAVALTSGGVMLALRWGY